MAAANDGPMLLGVSWGLSLLATIFLTLRVYLKLSTGRRLWWDDWILLASWVLIIVNDCVTTVLVATLGLGQPGSILGPQNPTALTLLLSSRATVTITATVWTKTAFAVTLLRLTEGATKKLLWFIIVSMNILMGVSALVPWIQCIPLDKGWIRTLDGACWAPGVGTTVWIATGAYSAAMDFVLAAIPWTFLPSLQLIKREKFGIAVAMSMGLVAGSVAIVKCVQLPLLNTGDGFQSVGLYIWDITETTVTVMAACIPALRLLIRKETGKIFRTPVLPTISVKTPQTQHSPSDSKPSPNGSEFAEYELVTTSTGKLWGPRSRGIV